MTLKYLYFSGWIALESKNIKSSFSRTLKIKLYHHFRLTFYKTTTMSGLPLLDLQTVNTRKRFSTIQLYLINWISHSDKVNAKKKCLLAIIHLKVYSKIVCQIKMLKLVGNNFFFSVIKPGFYFVLSRRQQILGSVLCFKKKAQTFSGEGSHVVHGAYCQGNHVLCLYMSRPNCFRWETIGLSGQRKQKMQIMMLMLLQKNCKVNNILPANSEKFSL